MRRSVDTPADEDGAQDQSPGEQAGTVPPQFDALFEKYYRPLVSYAARLTGSYEVAEDLVTDGFVVLYDRPERWEPEEVARRFLYRIVHNAAIDFLRAEHIRTRALRDVTDPGDVPGSAHALPSPNAQVEQEELLRALDAAIQSLPDKRRAVVTLRLEQGLRNKEIAEVLGVTVKAVELHLSLAMKDLRHALERFEDRGTAH